MSISAVPFELSKQKSKMVKAIAIIFVIMSHTGTFPWGGLIGVHLFLITSGYGIYCSLENKKEHYWIKRISSVYLPYLFCTVLFLLIRFFILKESYNLIRITVSFIGLDFGLNVDPTMWYISYIFAYYFIAWTAFKLKSSQQIANLFCLLSFGIITFMSYKYIAWHKGTVAWNYGFSFLIGMLLAKFRYDKEKENKILMCTLATVFSLGMLTLLFSHEILIRFCMTLYIAVLLIGIVGYIKPHKVLLYRCLSYIGEKSYFMYLNEAFLISVLKPSGGGGQKYCDYIDQ